MHESWKPILQSEFNQPYFKELSAFLHNAYTARTIYPPKQQVFSAFASDLNDIKVVIIGQDPYHGPRQANGLAFSVQDGIQFPPSLRNIFKEVHDDVGAPIPSSGDLTRWAKQGVMLLNNTLTVEAHMAGSHRGKGWEIFTEHIIKYLNENRPHLVFILWGRDARGKKPLIDQSKHFIIESAHPSPLSAHNGFFGSKPFSKCNLQLEKWNMPPIEW
ncbi:MAG: uracil-DNA glycosylase [Candidatus Saccharibacteria bacterium]|nr:uracil-DNA glycosylase [Candidatus Saccharibacteria bacterium]